MPGEVGSFFHWQEPGLTSSPEDWPAYLNTAAYPNSGRSALVAILGALREQGITRLLVPSYYCHSVVDYLLDRTNMRIDFYNCDPLEWKVPDSVPVDTALLVTSYFGAQPPPAAVPPARVILDVTHDPFATWISGYQADWIFGSLRKTLPLTEGGFAWSRVGTPVETHLQDRTGTADRLDQDMQAAMRAKAGYVARGYPADENKDEWYGAIQNTEDLVATLPPQRMAADNIEKLKSLPASRWHGQRMRNTRLLVSLLEDYTSVLKDATFGVVLILATPDDADDLARRLASERVYPARLWLLPPQLSEQCHLLDRRLLVVHTDHRYTSQDMARVAECIRLWSSHSP